MLPEWCILLPDRKDLVHVTGGAVVLQDFCHSGDCILCRVDVLWQKKGKYWHCCISNFTIISVADPWLFGTDPDPVLFVSDVQDANKKYLIFPSLFAYYSKVFFSVADLGYLSRIRIFSIPDPNFFHPGSKFSPSRIPIKEFKYFNPKNCFLSSRKYDPCFSSRILVFYPSRIQGSKKHRIPVYLPLFLKNKNSDIKKVTKQ